jgi:hypothetical protein
MLIKRLEDSGQQAGAIQPVGIGLGLGLDDLVVTAIATGAGHLRLITWRCHAGEPIVRLADSGDQAGAVKLVDLAGASNHRYVTAVRAANDHLLLIAWQVNYVTGEVSRLGDADDDDPPGDSPVSLIRMASLADGSVLLAVRAANGHLVVKHWTVTSDGKMKRLGDSAVQDQPTGAISDAALASYDGGFTTPVRDGSGRLKLIAWQVTATGGTKRLGDSGQLAGAISPGAIGVAGFGTDIVTAVETAAGNLRLITWSVSSSGSIQRRGDSGVQAGSVSLVSCAPVDNPEQTLVTAVRVNSGDLKLIVWQVDSSGAVTRLADSGDQAGGVSLIAATPLLGPNRILTAVRTSSGNLRLITWSITWSIT